jgi:hypothetical protein
MPPDLRRPIDGRTAWQHSRTPLTGAYAPSAGTLLLDGAPVTFVSPLGPDHRRRHRRSRRTDPELLGRQRPGGRDRALPASARRHRHPQSSLADRPGKESSSHGPSEPDYCDADQGWRASVFEGRPRSSAVRIHSDIGLPTRLGRTPTVNFGPGDPTQSHQPNERVAVRDLVDCTKAIALAIHSWRLPALRSPL